MSIDTSLLVTVALFFGMQSYDYLATPKGEPKQIRILRKGGIRFYRKCLKPTHNSGHIHLADNIPPTFSTQKNRVNNVTVTQWRIGIRLCPVHIWADII